MLWSLYVILVIANLAVSIWLFFRVDAKKRRKSRNAAGDGRRAKVKKANMSYATAVNLAQ